MQLLDEGVRELSSDRSFAVRSSAEGEDEERRSFADQFVTVLNVPADRLVESVERVWSSLSDHRLEGYSRAPDSMGVLIQHMVEPRVSGVSFSCDPLSGRSVAIIEAV